MRRLFLDGTVECRFEGWSNDLDEKGQPVRAAPDAGATVVGRLPPPVGIGLDEVSVTVSVTGYRDGWFRIDTALFRGDRNFASDLCKHRAALLVEDTLGATDRMPF